MEEKRSLLGSGLIWFGAAVSIAEIYTGTLLAPLGLTKGTAAIFIGHSVGGFLMYLAARIGAVMRKGAMESVKVSFGEQTAKFFATLNVLQLVGWTAVMIIAGSSALSVIVSDVFGFSGNVFWSVVIGVLIAFWIILDMEYFERINRFTMAGLFFLSIILSFVVFRGTGTGLVGGSMSFGAAIELSAAMPLSWLPLAADYVRDAERPKESAALSCAVYFAVSCWMYMVGLGAAIFTGESDIAAIMLKAGLGFSGILIILTSTVTTTFLDAYSGGISFSVIFRGASEKKTALAICAIGTLLAVFVPTDKYESYLYLISSVFAPMISIMIADFYILQKDASGSLFNARNGVIWCAGFALYRFFLASDLVIGSTLPVIAIVIALTCAADKVLPGKKI